MKIKVRKTGLELDIEVTKEHIEAMRNFYPQEDLLDDDAFATCVIENMLELAECNAKNLIRWILRDRNLAKDFTEVMLNMAVKRPNIILDDVMF